MTGPGAGNTVHPIPGSAAPSGSQARGTVTGSGKGIVTVTDARGNSFIIPDHGGGVAVLKTPEGGIKISNGVESRPLTGVKLTISGARTVSVEPGIQVGPAQADGSTVVMVPLGTVTGGPGPGGVIGGFGTAIKDGAKAVGNGILEGGDAVEKSLGIFQFEGKAENEPPPGPATSTIQQE